MKNRIKVMIFTLGMWASPSMAEVESWYAYWSLGVADHTYSPELEGLLNTLESLPNVERTEISMDMLGFYWPVLDGRTIVGAVVSATSDSFDVINTTEYFRINQYLYGLSAMRFMGNEPGDGFFVRGDAGIAKMTFESNSSGSVSSNSGVGFLLGLGYGFPVSEKTRLILGANYTIKKIEGEKTSAVVFGIGGLW